MDTRPELRKPPIMQAELVFGSHACDNAGWMEESGKRTVELAVGGNNCCLVPATRLLQGGWAPQPLVDKQLVAPFPSLPLTWCVWLTQLGFRLMTHC